MVWKASSGEVGNPLRRRATRCLLMEETEKSSNNRLTWLHEALTFWTLHARALMTAERVH